MGHHFVAGVGSFGLKEGVVFGFDGGLMESTWRVAQV